MWFCGTLTRGALFISALFSAMASADDETFKIDVTELRPTQFSVGFKEIDYRVKKIEEADEAGELKDLKKENVGKVVIGPGGKFYLIDGHHFARAILESGRSKMLVTIEKDWSDLTEDEFWDKMQKKNFCLLTDEKGKKRTVGELKRKTIRSLVDDPYRSLAYFVRKAGGYKKDESRPFQEFHWAKYFRSRIKPSELTKEDWTDVVAKAVLMAQSKSAEKLPGYKGTIKDCKWILRAVNAIFRE